MKFFIIATLVFHVILLTDCMYDDIRKIEMEKRPTQYTNPKEVIVDFSNNLNTNNAAPTKEYVYRNSANKQNPEAKNFVDKTIAKIQHEYLVYEKNKEIIASQNGELTENVELYSQNSEFEKFVTQKDEPRRFPLFTTFNFQETGAQIPKILYSLTEEEAIYLWNISPKFREIVQEAQDVKKDVTYCSNYDRSLTDACEAIRRGSFAIFNQVYRRHMEMIMEWANCKQGVIPPEYVFKVRADGSIQIQEQDLDNFVDWDNTYVNEIWDGSGNAVGSGKKKKDVGYVLNAANAIEIPAICKLMGAKIASEIDRAIAHGEKTFELLANEILDNDFLREDYK